MYRLRSRRRCCGVCFPAAHAPRVEPERLQLAEDHRAAAVGAGAVGQPQDVRAYPAGAGLQGGLIGGDGGLGGVGGGGGGGGGKGGGAEGCGGGGEGGGGKGGGGGGVGGGGEGAGLRTKSMAVVRV